MLLVRVSMNDYALLLFRRRNKAEGNQQDPRRQELTYAHVRVDFTQ